MEKKVSLYESPELEVIETKFERGILTDTSCPAVHCPSYSESCGHGDEGDACASHGSCGFVLP